MSDLEDIDDDEVEMMEDESEEDVGSDETDGENESHEKRSSVKPREVYLPGQALAADEELVCDESAYLMYHRIQTGLPCLSFDVLRDDLGDKREEYPLTLYLLAGTQAKKSKDCNGIVLKLSNINGVNAEDTDSDSDSDEEEEEKTKPKLEVAVFRHEGSVNRVRSTVIDQKHVAATWSENGKVYIWDLTSPLCAVNSSAAMACYKSEKQLPLFAFSSHLDEGFAMDWSPLEPGTLATGDCVQNIHVWQLEKCSAKWNVNPVPLEAHSQSVEDLQWSPTECNWLASCSVDKSIRIWDVRIAPQKACKIVISPAHNSDVNVISWNKLEARYIASGGDDGMIKVWDLRHCKPDQPLSSLPTVGKFKHHTEPITSVEWSPHDSSVLAACGEDNQLTQWDIAVEKADVVEDEPDILPQLLFIHQGQEEMKELHWHSQLPGVIISTALNDFNVFRTISV